MIGVEALGVGGVVGDLFSGGYCLMVEVGCWMGG